MQRTTPAEFAALWAAAMAQARADLPGASADDLHDIVASVLRVRLVGA